MQRSGAINIPVELSAHNVTATPKIMIMTFDNDVGLQARCSKLICYIVRV